MPLNNNEIKKDLEQISLIVKKLKAEIAQVIVGQEYLIDRLILALLVNNHVLVEGVPGLAKTLAVKTLAEAVNLSFSRIQFTPDLLPADLVGTLVYNPKQAVFSARKGPIFANIVLADEINRAPAKVQSALLEAMQERQVTLGDNTFVLPDPFFVMATQNPIEQEGTYPLPEAQLDRFLMKLVITYPSKEEEKQIIRKMAQVANDISVNPILNREDILKARKLVDKIYVDEKIEDYILDIVNATRAPENYNLAKLKPLIQYGASPRASIGILLAAKAHALLEGQEYVTPYNVKSVALDVLRHRIIISYEAEAEQVSSEDIIKEIIENINTP